MSTTPPPTEAENEAAWLAEQDRVVRTITLETLAGGCFAIREGEVHSIGLGWDEMLGHLAAMTIPKHLKDRGHIYPMTTDAEDEQRERKLQEMRDERKTINEHTKS